MIRSMTHAAATLGNRRWLESAQRAMDFVRGALWRNGQLRVFYKDGAAPGGAHLDDYAFLLAALLDFLQADFRAVDLALARPLADTLPNRFEDRQAGGFFFTAHGHGTRRLSPQARPGQCNPLGQWRGGVRIAASGPFYPENRAISTRWNAP